MFTIGVAAATLHLDSFNPLIILGTETALSSILVSYGWALTWYHVQFLGYKQFIIVLTKWLGRRAYPTGLREHVVPIPGPYDPLRPDYDLI